MAARTIPGHRMPQIEPLHVDDTVCEHAIAPSGKPRDPDSGCTGRAMYRATCECGWTRHDPVRESLKVTRDGHRQKAEEAAANTQVPSAPAVEARSAAVSTVSVCHLPTGYRDVLYRPGASLWALIAEATRVHGKKRAANSHLRLYRGLRELDPADTAEAAGITPGDLLELRDPGSKPKEAEV